MKSICTQGTEIPWDYWVEAPQQNKNISLIIEYFEKNLIHITVDPTSDLWNKNQISQNSSLIYESLTIYFCNNTYSMLTLANDFSTNF